MKIVECVPNFSEGRRPDVVQKIVAAGTAVPGITLLGCESDADHNRSVVTFIGPPDAVVEAAFRMTRAASTLIDLTAHKGEHPRMGATDVIPFIPVQDVTTAECVELAKRLGARVGAELGIPVFLYADAAQRLERKRLPDIRKGEFEGLSTRIGTDPSCAPDFGPNHIHPKAGCTAIGARFFLVAFNVNLASKDMGAAKEIGRAIRESGEKIWRKNPDGTKTLEREIPGMFPALQADGFELTDRGMVQVSMNLMDYRVTGIETVFDEISRRAAAKGIAITESEIVGLVPRDALVSAATQRFKLTNFKAEQIIETHLDRSRGDVYSACDPFLDALQSGAPTPGGGSASALAGALGAALGAMVTNLTIGKKKYAEAEGVLTAARTRLLDGLGAMRAAAREDAVQYDRVMAAYKLPKATPADETTRNAAITHTLIDAAHAPLNAMRAAAALLPDLLTVAEKGNPNAASDAAVGALLIQACVHGSAYNVLINAKSLGDHPEAARLREATATVRAAVDTGARAVLTAVDRAIGL